MTFPQTHASLIHRLAVSGNEQDWQAFLSDYWGPICRFAVRFGNCSWQDAEDVASQTFLAIFDQKLLAQWESARSAKLRTLVCAIVRNILANKARVQTGRARILEEHGPEIAKPDQSEDSLDRFYSAWVDEIVEQAISAVQTEFQCAGKGDHLRILYGKVCEGLTTAEIADVLSMTASQVDQGYKDARNRLTQQLEFQVRAHVRRYCADEDPEAEFAVEWRELGQHLKNSGGLELAVRRASEQNPSGGTASDKRKMTLNHLKTSR